MEYWHILELNPRFWNKTLGIIKHDIFLFGFVITGEWRVAHRELTKGQGSEPNRVLKELEMPPGHIKVINSWKVES